MFLPQLVFRTTNNLLFQLVYLIVVVSIGASAFPMIAIIMLAVVYGLQVRALIFCQLPILIFGQAIIFLIKREFMLIGWMVVYILSYVFSYPYFSASY